MAMRNKDFAVFILTHGRPDRVKTYKALRKTGYTGDIYLIVDNEDKSLDKYIEKYGDSVKVFEKQAMIDTADSGNNFNERRTILYARNACHDIAKEIGLKYFLELDDDYSSFTFRYEHGYSIKDMDAVIDAFLDYYISIDCLSIAFSQGGDHIGGFSGVKLKRKCMNSFFCAVDRPFKFIGALNDDVNMYVMYGSRGKLLLTFTPVQLNQEATQKQAKGLTDMYLRFGTYIKSFTTVMMHPSSVKVSMMTSKNERLHHAINWAATVPLILPEKYKK